MSGKLLSNVRIAIVVAGMASALVSTSVALAGKADDTLNVAFPRETDFIDQLHTNSTESTTSSRIIYDALLYEHPITGKISPQLATAWTWVNETTVEFDLRQGVRFHNGEDFDADDVLFTVAFVTDMDNKLRQQKSDFGFIKGAEKLGQYKVRFNLNEPKPTAELIFAGRLIIWPNEYTAANGGHEIHASKPVGTGPYAVTSYIRGQEVVLKANTDYFEGSKPGPQIGTIKIRTIPDIQTQVAEMLGGGLDFIWNLPKDQAESLIGNPNLQVAYGSTARITLLSLDVVGRSGDTPITKTKVRRALAHGIDRETIATYLIGGTSKALVSHCHPDQFLCSQDVPKYTYDPTKAKALLAEAGYPEGFKVTMIAGGAALRPIGEAIQGNLAKIGIDLTFENYTLPAWRKMLFEDKSTISLFGWGGSQYDVSYALPVFFTGGKPDYARDKELEGWIKAGSATADVEKRRDLYNKALTRIADQVLTLPLYSNTVTFVMSKDVSYTPGRGGSPEFSNVRWK